MHKIQVKYMELKNKYDQAFQKQDWDTVDSIEDDYIDAEFELFDWVGEQLIKTGKMSKEDIEFMKRKSNNDQWEKMLELGCRLSI